MIDGAPPEAMARVHLRGDGEGLEFKRAGRTKAAGKKPKEGAPPGIVYETNHLYRRSANGEPADEAIGARSRNGRKDPLFGEDAIEKK